jgi:hypothetical protein
MEIGSLTIEQAIKDLKILQKKVDQMYWDYDRLSRSGQDTLDDIAKLVGFEDKLS